MFFFLLLTLGFSASLTPLTECTKARITYYSGYESGGACGFPDISTKVTAGYMFFSAPNTAFYDKSNKCGICYEMVGPNGALRFMVSDECPQATNSLCRGDMIHVDLADNAFSYVADKSLGKTNVTMRMVACDHTGKIKILSQSGTSVYWYSFVVLNHVIGVASASISNDGGSTWTAASRTAYNAFVLTPKSALKLPFQVKVTSIAGDSVIIDVTNADGGKTIEGRGQFAVPSKEWFDIETLKQVTKKPADADGCCAVPDDFTVLYDDKLEGVWKDSSFSTTTSYSYATSPKEGKYCIQSSMKSYGGVQIITNIPARADQYTHIEFYLKTEGTCNLCIFVQGVEATKGGVSVGPSAANTWTYIKLKLSDIGYPTKGFAGVMFQNDDTVTRKVYFDKIQLVKDPSAPDAGVCWK